MCVCMSACAHILLVQRWQSPEEGMGSPEASVTGGCEPRKVGAGN